jgi:hypothetical protein
LNQSFIEIISKCQTNNPYYYNHSAGLDGVSGSGRSSEFVDPRSI